jgi:hypothetical protein
MHALVELENYTICFMDFAQLLCWDLFFLYGKLITSTKKRESFPLSPTPVNQYISRHKKNKRVFPLPQQIRRPL